MGLGRVFTTFDLGELGSGAAYPPPGVRMEMIPSGGTSTVPLAGIRFSSPSIIRSGFKTRVFSANLEVCGSKAMS